MTVEETIEAKLKLIATPNVRIKGRGVRSIGRPKGVKNKGYGSSNWEPTKWKVDYEVAVLMHVNGKTNKEVAESMGKSAVFIGMLLRTKKAAEVIERIRTNLPERALADRYESILDKASERMVSFINDEGLFNSTQPGIRMAATDRAMKMAEMIDARLKTRLPGEKVTERTLVLATSENISKLVAGLDKSNQVTEMHRGDLKVG